MDMRLFGFMNVLNVSRTNNTLLRVMETVKLSRSCFCDSNFTFNSKKRACMPRAECMIKNVQLLVKLIALVNRTLINRRA